MEGQKLTERIMQLILRRATKKDIARQLSVSEARVDRILARARKRPDDEAQERG